MQSLTDYIKSHRGKFTVAGTESTKLLIFDVDDTLIHTTANVWITKNGARIKKISNQQFNDYHLKPGEGFDFGEFNDPDILANEKTTKYFDTLKREYRKGTHISILTARNNTEMIRDFFLHKYGIDIKPALVFAIGDSRLGVSGSVQECKAQVIEHIIKLGYRTLVFFDDNEGNLESAKEAVKKSKHFVKIHTVKA